MATDYTSQINAIQQSVSYTNASAGDLAVYNAELNNGSSLAQVAQQIVNSSYVTSVVDPVIALYQGAFGRVPDAAGLKAEVQAVEAGVPLAPRSATDNSSLVFQFANSPEFTARYGVTALSPSSPALVQLLYQNVLGRAPDAAGLAYWTAQPLNAQQLLAAFSLPSLDPEYSARVSQQVKSFEYDETGQAGSQPTPTMGSLFQVPVNQGATNGPGSSFQFTTSIDNLQGTNGNDTFTGDNTNTGGIFGGGSPTVTAGDTANGGAGTDTFNYFVAPAAGATVIPQLNSIEIVNFVGGANGQTFDLSNATGVTNANLKNETTGGQTVTVANGTTVGFDNVKFAGGTDTANFGATATNGSLAFTNGDALNTLTVTGAALTSLNLNSTGAANTITNLNTAAGVKSLSITADQNLTITNALNGNVISVDGSSASGNLKFTFGSTPTGITATANTGSGNDFVDISGTGGDNVQVNLGAGNDTLRLGGVLNGGTGLTAGTSLDGGVGTDIINITAGGDLTAATAAFIKNFETLDVSGGAGTYNTSLAESSGAFTTFQADHNISGNFGAVVLSNVASTGASFADIGLKGGATTADTSLTVNLKTATSATDAFTLNLTASDGNNDAAANGQVTLTTFNASGNGGVENLTINSSVMGIDTGLKGTSYTNTITTLTDASGGAGDPGLTTLTLTGNADLTVTNALLAATTANLTTVNASASTGNIGTTANNFDISSAVKAVNYSGSAGIDTVTIGKAGGSFYGGAGNDTVTFSAAHSSETFVFKATGDTTQTVAAGQTVITAGSGLETIGGAAAANQFQAIADNVANGHDTIDVTNLAFTGVARGVDQLGAITAPDGGAFNANQANFFVDAGGTRGVAVGTAGGNTYVFIDANHDGNFNAATDLVVKLTGVHTLAAGDFAF